MAQLPQGQVQAQLVEIVAEPVQQVLGVTNIAAHEPGLHLVVLGDQDREHPVAAQADELDVLQAHPLGPGGQDQGRMAAHRREHPGGLAEQVLGLAGRRRKGRLDLFPHRRPQFLDGQDVVHVIAEALGGGQPAGGGVGLLQEASFLQVHHQVADAGRRQVEARHLGHHPGTHRFAGDDILSHHGLQDPGVALS